jgi:hypothetical protein
MTIFNLSLLSFLLRKKIGNLGATKMLKPVAIMITASIICGLVSYLVYMLVSPLTATLINAMGLSLAKFAKTLHLLIAIGLASGVGMVLYLAFCQAFKLEETNEIIKRFKHKLKAK